MKSSFTGARVVQKDVVKLARKQVATVAAVSVPEGVTLEKMGKVRLETRATPQTPNVHSPDTPSSPAGPHPRRGRGRRDVDNSRNGFFQDKSPPSMRIPLTASFPAHSFPNQDLLNTTYYPKGEDTDCSRKPWIVIDAEGLRLGRLSTLIATYLRGGNVGSYSPSMNMGTYVVVINAEKVTVSGKKMTDKVYRRHETGRPGSMKEETFIKLQQRIPERIIEKAVKGMLPKNRMGREVFGQMKVYAGPDHPHAAQSPVDVTAEVKARCYSSTQRK